MPTHIALLRGINVGGRNRVAMADLRKVVLGLGHTEVATYIQSGNVVFTSEEPDSAAIAALERAIAEHLGVRPKVIVLTRAELARVVGHTLFLHTPGGLGRSELATRLLRLGGSRTAEPAGTARNWATVNKLLALCST
jgi:uncharacterized protein (DUF1697 family)